MIVADTDNDGLLDYDEINVYHTSPINQDTDDDKVNDGTEVAIGSDPNKAEITFTTTAEGGTVANDITISVSMKSASNGAGTLKVEHVTMENNPLISPMIPDFLDSAYEVTTDSLSFEVENQRIEGNKVIAEVTHFSTYILLNKADFNSV